MRVVGGRGCCCLLFTSHATDSGPGCSNMNTQCRVDVIELYGIMRYYGKQRVQLVQNTVPDEDSIVPMRSKSESFFKTKCTDGRMIASGAI